MASLPGIIIKIGADTTDAIQGLNRTERALGRQLTTGEKLDRVWDKAQKALIGVGIAAGVMAVKLGTDAVQAAIEDEKAMATLGRTMENLGFGARTTEVEALISRMSALYGVTDQETRPAFDRLVRSTRDVGEAERALQLAYEASVGTGKSLEAVASALGKAYDGNTGALAKLGLGLDAATIKSGDMDAITAAMASTFAGQAATSSQTLAGQLQVVTTAAGEASEKIGYSLLRAVDSLTGSMGGGQGLGAAIEGTASIMDDLITGLALVLKRVTDLKPGVDEGTSGWQQLGDAVDFALTTFVPGGAIIKGVGLQILGMGSDSNRAREQVLNLANAAQVAGARYTALANSIAQTRAALNNTAVAARYTALAVQEFQEHPSFTGGNLFTYFNEIDAVADKFSGGGGGSLASAIDKVNPRIAAQTALTQRHIEKLGILRDRVSELVQEQQAYVTATAAQISGGISFSAVFDSENVATSIEAFRAQIGDVAKFSTALAGLASRIGTSPGAQALIAQIQGLGAKNGNAVLAGMTDEVATGLAGDLNTALGTINGNASLMGGVFYQQGINAAVALSDAMAVQVAADEEKLKAIGRQIGAPIGAEIRAEIAAAISEAMNASAGYGAAAVGAAAAAAVAAAGTTINITGATVIDPTNVTRTIEGYKAMSRARTGQ
jgi:hypothetical protein